MEKKSAKVLEKMFSLQGTVALVTGGASGIGFGISQMISDVGGKVAIVDANRENGERAGEVIRKGGGEAISFQCDISKEVEVEEIAQRVEKSLGPVDILVNSAGINIRKKALEFSVAEWQKIIDVNLTGTFLACRAVGKRMVARRSGRIVNIASIGSLIGIGDLGPYCASKAGVSQLTKVLAIEWAPFGVLVNAIGPGRIRTPLTADLIKTEGFDEMIKATVPLQKIGDPEDLVGIVLLLCSSAGSYITGQTVYIDGGWSLW
jgi:2-dehydro-3-deoxy-D-gluconate 5-dehydrogenase